MLVICLLCALAGGVGAQSAHAAAGACNFAGSSQRQGEGADPNGVLGGDVSFPTYVTAGRTERIPINPGGATGVLTGEYEPVFVTATRQDGSPLSAPIAPFTFTAAQAVAFANRRYVSHGNVPMKFALADSPVVVHVSGVESDTSTYPWTNCRFDLLSAPLPVRPPRLQLDEDGIHRDIWRGPGRWQSADFGLDTSGCADDSVISIRLTQPGWSRTVRSRKRCKWPKDHFTAGRHRLIWATDPSYGFSLSLNTGKQITTRVRYAIRLDGRPYRSGLVKLHARFIPGVRSRRIYDTSYDAFVNVCINGSYRTWAHNGHLYCQTDGRPPRWYVNVLRLT